MPEPTLYLFDGYNLLHAGAYEDRQELVDRLADFVAVRGARGVVVFDGVGEEASYGRLQVRFAPAADPVLERLAAEHRSSERVLLVSSDAAIRGTAGQEVRKRSSASFLRDLAADPPRQTHRHPPERSRVEDALDEETRRRLESWRRRRS